MFASADFSSSWAPEMALACSRPLFFTVTCSTDLLLGISRRSCFLSLSPGMAVRVLLPKNARPSLAFPETPTSSVAKMDSLF